MRGSPKSKFYPIPLLVLKIRPHIYTPWINKNELKFHQDSASVNSLHFFSWIVLYLWSRLCSALGSEVLISILPLTFELEVSSWSSKYLNVVFFPKIYTLLIILILDGNSFVYRSFVISFEIRKHESSSFVLFQDSFGYLEFLAIPYEFLDRLVNFYKRLCLILKLNMQMTQFVLRMYLRDHPVQHSYSTHEERPREAFQRHDTS